MYGFISLRGSKKAINKPKQLVLKTMKWLLTSPITNSLIKLFDVIDARKKILL